MQVEGVLVATNAYSTPFEPVCANCNSPSSASAFINDGTINCLRCSAKWTYIYSHCVNTVIQTLNNKIVHCIVRQPVLQYVLPGLTEFPYEIYLQKKANIVYMLRDFHVHRKFTLNEDNVILHIGWTKKKKNSYHVLTRNETVWYVSIHVTQSRYE